MHENHRHQSDRFDQAVRSALRLAQVSTQRKLPVHVEADVVLLATEFLEITHRTGDRIAWRRVVRLHPQRAHRIGYGPIRDLASRAQDLLELSPTAAVWLSWGAAAGGEPATA